MAMTDKFTTVFVSNISLTDNGKDYYGGYVNDDWKFTPKLTVNLGLRYDFFGLVGEHHENQANFVPAGPPTGSPTYIIPVGKNSGNLSPSFLSLLRQGRHYPRRHESVWPRPGQLSEEQLCAASRNCLSSRPQTGGSGWIWHLLQWF